MEQKVSLVQIEVFTPESIPGILAQKSFDLENKNYPSRKLAKELKNYAEKALRIGEFSAAAEFYEQRFLAGRHMGMDAGNGGINLKNSETYIGGLIMLDSLLKADSIIKKHTKDIDLTVKTRIDRFRGRLYEDLKMYGPAMASYENALHIFKNESPDLITEANCLELEASIAGLLAKTGQEDRAIEANNNCLENFEHSPAGIELKKVDPDRYAIWRSAVGIRGADYFCNSPDPKKQEYALMLIKDAETTLTQSGVDPLKMERRLAEVGAIKTKIGL